MRIVIIGAGSAGRQLARRLYSEKHDVILIDVKAEPLQETETILDIQIVHGSGSSPAVLKEAQIEKAELVVAVTGSDETNMLACLLAHQAGVSHTVARVTNIDFIHAGSPFSPRELGIDKIVSQKEECARELFNVLRLPGTLEVVDVLDEHAIAVGIKVDIDSPLLLTTLKDFPRKDLIQSIRFIAQMHGSKVQIPTGDSQFQIGDDVYLLGEANAISEFLAWAFPEQKPFERIIIAGGGDLGFHLARNLESIRAEIVILEPDSERAHFCADHLDRTLVIKANPLDPESLNEAGITEDTAFVAATDDDENNIICCLMAEKKGARFTAAQVIKTEYAPIISSLSLLDRALNPYTSMINTILRYVRGAHVEAAASLYSLPGELFEIRLPEGSANQGRAIKDVDMPGGSIIAAVLRGDALHVAVGDFVLEAGDRLVLYALPDATGRILKQLRETNDKVL